MLLTSGNECGKVELEYVVGKVVEGLGCSSAELSVLALLDVLVLGDGHLLEELSGDCNDGAFTQEGALLLRDIL